MKCCATLIAFLALAAPTQANSMYPGQRAAHDPTLDAILATADTYWTGQGVPLPCPATVLDVADSLTGDDSPGYDPRGRGYSPLFGYDDCRIVLNAPYAGQLLELLHSRRQDRWIRRDAAGELCMLITHEAGHVRGLPHSESGLMREDAWRLSRWEDMPHECRMLARRLVPRLTSLRKRT